MDLSAQQTQAVAACIADVKKVIGDKGVTRDGVGAVKDRLLQLAGEPGLFENAQFPVQDGDGPSSLYLLSEDNDHGFALYVVAEKKGNMSPPHDHTTWAVIVGIEGEEVNRLYDRIDNGAEPGKAEVREREEVVVGRGTGVAFLPDDIHSIHCVTDAPTINFHLYGVGIEQQTQRKMFNQKTGTYKVFPANPHIYR